jgi:hypothetical protein
MRTFSSLRRILCLPVSRAALMVCVMLASFQLPAGLGHHNART